MGTWIWLWPLTDTLQEGLLCDGDPRILLIHCGWDSFGFCSVCSDNFFVVTYTCPSLVLAINFCYSQLNFFFFFFFFLYISYLKKNTKINNGKKRWNIMKKMNSLKKGEGVSLLNFEVGPRVPLLNFEGGPEVSLLNFRRVSGPTLNFWGESWVPGSGSWCPEFLGSGVLVSLLHHVLGIFRTSFLQLGYYMNKSYPKKFRYPLVNELVQSTLYMIFIKYDSLKSNMFSNPIFYSIFISCFSGSTFFCVQVFLSPAFSRSRSVF